MYQKIYVVSNSNLLKSQFKKLNYNLEIQNIDNINKKKSSAYLGILVGDKKFQNKGVAQEIINNISKYLFINHKIVNIYLGVDRSNHSAVKAYLKSGFIFEKKKNLMVRNYFLTKLCIGTAQFGSNYGIANQTGRVKWQILKR